MASRHPQTNRGRGLWLLGWGGGGALLTWILAMIGFGWAQGPGALAGAAAGGAVTWVFFVLGQLVQVALADAEALIAMMSAMLSYVIRVVGLVLAAVLLNRFLPELDGLAIAVAAIAVAVGWTTAEIWAYTRLRIPVFDSSQGKTQ
ncbi:MAG: hypothetical protein LWW77_04970 [Propionibacteriales bacterium]|nr:hypothetical protein [Propionibacteriales bacterium]